MITDSDGNGKTDQYRPVDKKKYDKNWERIYGHKSKNITSKRRGNGKDRR